MTNEQIYSEVCKLHWRSDLGYNEIVEKIGAINLLNYQHETKVGVRTYDNAKNAVSAIISCEITSHQMATDFKLEKYRKEIKRIG